MGAWYRSMVSSESPAAYSRRWVKGDGLAAYIRVAAFVIGVGMMFAMLALPTS